MGTKKLVRDKMPDIIRAAGDTPTYYRADDGEFEQRLVDKLLEEAVGVCADCQEEELADLLEVIHTICEVKGYKLENIHELMKRKAVERGRFTERFILDMGDN